MMNDGAATTPATMTASFRKATGKRKGEAFVEDGAWWAIDADGHQWCHVDGDWMQFTYDDDGYVLELRAESNANRKRAA